MWVIFIYWLLRHAEEEREKGKNHSFSVHVKYPVSLKGITSDRCPADARPILSSNTSETSRKLVGNTSETETSRKLVGNTSELNCDLCLN